MLLKLFVHFVVQYAFMIFVVPIVNYIDGEFYYYIVAGSFCLTNI
jgi:hypothetical protein